MEEVVCYSSTRHKTQVLNVQLLMQPCKLIPANTRNRRMKMSFHSNTILHTTHAYNTAHITYSMPFTRHARTTYKPHHRYCYQWTVLYMFAVPVLICFFLFFLQGHRIVGSVCGTRLIGLRMCSRTEQVGENIKRLTVH